MKDKALKEMINGKAEGEDMVTIEFVKYQPGIWIREVVEIMNGLLKGEDLVE